MNVLIIDLGAGFTKAASVRDYVPQPNEPQHWNSQVDRLGPAVTEEESLQGNARDWEFPAWAAFVDGNFRLCSSNAGYIDCYPCKTIFTHASGIGRLNLEGAAKLLQAVRQRRVTPPKELEILLQHFRVVQEAENRHCRKHRFVHNVIVVTFPNYLKEEEHEQDFLKYQTFYLIIIRTIWPHIEDVFFVSEGQAPLHQVFTPHKDNQGLFDQEELWTELGVELSSPNDPQLYSHTAVAVDQGSSTTNIHVGTVFIQAGAIVGIQTSVGPDWVSGIQGGSQLSNDAMRRFARRLKPHTPPEQLANIMRAFEDYKYKFDYTGKHPENRLMTFNGLDDRYSVKVKRSQVASFMRAAFRPNRALVRQEVPKIVKLMKQDLTFMYSGGSYRNPGLRKIEGDFMGSVAKKAKRDHGIDVKHIFTRRFDRSWSSHVSIGAGLCVFNLPLPEAVLTGWRLGLHRHVASDESGDGFDKDETADFLMCKGYSVLPEIEIKIPATPQEREDVRFHIVAAPIEEGHGSQGATRIKIGTYAEVFRQKIPVTYNLAWYVPASGLRPGTYRVRARGPDAQRLATGPADQVSDRKSLTFWIEFHELLNRGPAHSQNDKRWYITVRTDVASRYLTVTAERQTQIFWCNICDEEAFDKVNVCSVCPGFYMCDACYVDDQHEHDEDHLFDERELAVGRV